MRIGILSDTHNRPVDLILDRLRGVDELWHLGDVCHPSTLDSLYSLGVPLLVVRGNNDFELEWPLTLDLRRGDVNFHLVHIPTNHPPASAQLVLNGHTHVPRDETRAGVRYLNPGSAGLANKGAPRSFAILTLRKGEIDWKVERVSS